MFSNTFPERAVISETVAKMLLEIKAVHFRADLYGRDRALAAALEAR